MVRRGKKYIKPEKPYLRSIEVIGDMDEKVYPYMIPAIRDLDGFSFHKDMTILVGENGSGKSTILEALALGLGFSAEGGSKDHIFETEHTTSSLHEILKIRRGLSKPRDSFFLRAESFYNFSSFIDNEGSPSRYGGSLHQMSHGESFLSLLVERFEGNGLYILDEPEAALSPQRQLSALVRIHDLIQNNSQFVIATHSPILMAYPEARIIQLDENGWRVVSYEETEHFEVTKFFLNNYERQIYQLFK